MRYSALACSLMIVLGFASFAFGFETSWTDLFDETTYTITGPDLALVDDTILITLTATDLFYPDDMVAAPWSFLEDSLEVDGGFGLFLTGGGWASEYAFVYTAPGTHAYTFTGQDLGHGGGGHSWEWFSIGSTTVVSEPTAVARGTWGGIKALFRD